MDLQTSDAAPFHSPIRMVMVPATESDTRRECRPVRSDRVEARPYHVRNATGAFLLTLGIIAASAPSHAEPAPALAARVVVVGIPGAGAASAVGAFHAGGPIGEHQEVWGARAGEDGRRKLAG